MLSPAAPGLIPTEWIANEGVLETILDAPRSHPVRHDPQALDTDGEQKGRRAQLCHLGKLVRGWHDLPPIVAGCGRPLVSRGQTLHLTAPHEALSDHHLVVAEFCR